MSTPPTVGIAPEMHEALHLRNQKPTNATVVVVVRCCQLADASNLEELCVSHPKNTALQKNKRHT